MSTVITPAATRWRARLTVLVLGASCLVAVSAPGPATGAGPSVSRSAAGQLAAIEPPADIVSQIAGRPHPRLLATTETFDRARNRLATDSRAQRWFTAVRERADRVLDTNAEKLPTNERLTSGEVTADDVKRRIYALGLVWNIAPSGGTNPQEYAQRARAELLAAASLQTWNPDSRFLDVAQMTHALAIGYDWFYQFLSASDRTTIRDAIIRHGIDATLPLLGGGNFTAPHNWNIVCNGVALGALAIGADAGDTARTKVNNLLVGSVRSIQYGIAEYGPDGAYAEGPAYWLFATEYLVTWLAAFTTATGTDFGISGLPGLAKTGDFAIHVSGPKGALFNYGDGGTGFYNSLTAGGRQVPYLMWLAQRYQRPEWAAWAASRADEGATPLDILWYDPATATGATHPAATDAYFRRVEVATARSDWDDPNGVYVATKGLRAGSDPVAGHENLDAGSFVLDAAGTRWFEELGADDYDLANYFTWQSNTGGRWDHYVNHPQGQNTMLLGAGPTPTTALAQGARIVSTGSSPQQWHAITDLTAMYGGPVQQARRGIRLFDDRRQVLVQDEVRSTTAIDYRSFLHTRADVVLAPDGRSATLHRGDERLGVQLVGPAGATMSIGLPAPMAGSPNPPGQNSQPGLRKLVVHLPGVTNATVALRLTPLFGGEQPPAAPSLTPLANWSLPAPPTTQLAGLHVDGAPVAGFTPNRFRYDVVLAPGTTGPPQVTPVSQSGGYAQVSQATEVPGTATVATYRQDGAAGPSYKVHFRVPGKTRNSLPIASVTAAESANRAAATIDADLGTTWAGSTLDVDLGAQRTVGAVNVAFAFGSQRSFAFDLLASTDGTSWQAAATGAVSSAATDNAEVYPITPTTARYVRLVGRGNSSTSSTVVAEVRMYASTTDAYADMPARRMTPTADAFVRCGTHASTNYGEEKQLEIRNHPNDPAVVADVRRLSYLRFEPASVPGTVRSATLWLHGGMAVDPDVDFTTSAVLRVDMHPKPEWKEDEIMCDGRPALGAILGVIGMDEQKMWRRLDLTSYVKDQLAAGMPISIAVAQLAAGYGPWVGLNSKEANFQRPFLELTVS
ncbi:discoidin domain-containing protein [Micromonospora taraxaci]|uniref:CBM96 family carbohydrate-binding protein n=1 Tax=Micromonospora taraxaci TaxID=1316803 RepID=UPI0033E4759D